MCKTEKEEEGKKDFKIEKRDKQELKRDEQRN